MRNAYATAYITTCEGLWHEKNQKFQRQTVAMPRVARLFSLPPIRRFHTQSPKIPLDTPIFPPYHIPDRTNFLLER